MNLYLYTITFFLGIVSLTSLAVSILSLQNVVFDRLIQTMIIFQTSYPLFILCLSIIVGKRALQKFKPGNIISDITTQQSEQQGEEDIQADPFDMVEDMMDQISENIDEENKDPKGDNNETSN